MTKLSNAAQIQNYLLEKGARGLSSDEGSYKWQIKTICGPLNISIHDSDFTKEGQLRKTKGKNQIACIYCRFKDVEAANSCNLVDKRRLNKYSGKWNFIVGQEDGDTKSVWEYCFSLFSYELERILV